MKKHIENFSKYLNKGYEIGSKISLTDVDGFETLVLVGMGGSGMALTVMKGLVDSSKQSMPSQVINEYFVPNRVNEKTLMICASYSGNTEETVSAMKDALSKGAKMIVLTSGGDVADFCEQGGHIYAKMPTGIEPRAALPFSFGIQVAIFEKLGFLENVKIDLDRFSGRTKTHTEKVVVQAKLISEQLHDRFPFIYATSGYEAVALRAEQQIQENARMLAHHHILPEQNHNELLGRQEGNDHVDVLWLIDPDAYERNKIRIALSKQVLDERGIKQIDIVLQGDSRLQKTISGIYQVDWLSYYLALKRGVDPSGMKIIEDLKNALKIICI